MTSRHRGLSALRLAVAAPQTQPCRALFHVTAVTEPSLLPRLVAPVARLGCTPTRLHASTESGDGSEMTVDLRVAGLTRQTADWLAGNLRAVVGVQAVIAVLEPE
ncbi:MAG: hypothetical protein ACOYLQ_09115 [Hyphomicrobiaceae bacterium]